MALPDDIDPEGVKKVHEIAKLLEDAIVLTVFCGSNPHTRKDRAASKKAWKRLANKIIEFAAE